MSHYQLRNQYIEPNREGTIKHCLRIVLAIVQPISDRLWEKTFTQFDFSLL
ncbi:hypothetical protein [Nostoc sp. T09]|uniref:hypothetical protein n=1 Tax=Nostoc sp. T09 TaxID=1932621 RepID=UPI0015C4EFF4|nr:hypothetical protein [Nostoc sp. T09]